MKPEQIKSFSTFLALLFNNFIAPTPEFSKWVRNIGIVLGGVSTVAEYFLEQQGFSESIYETINDAVFWIGVATAFVAQLSVFTPPPAPHE